MPIVTRKPQNASLRFQTFVSNDDLTRKKPEKSLIKGLRRRGGRNAYGRITCRHHGGGAARKYRLVDFKYTERGVPGIVKAIEYDPNRNVRVALTVYHNGSKHYLLLPEGVNVGTVVHAAHDAELRTGNSTSLRRIPVGFMVYNLEISPGSGGKLVRSAGVGAQIVAKTDTHATLKMPSGEIRMLDLECWASIGVLGNADFQNITIGKAGRSRHRGIRPTVRGMAMNPVDHPHGGGEGRTKSGSHPTTPWGKGCKGTRTRKRKNPLILKRRK